MNTLRFARIASGLLALGAALDLSAQVLSYSQNFDTLPFSTSTQLNWTDDSTLAGWYLSDHTLPSRNLVGVPSGTSSYIFADPANLSDLALGSFTTSTATSSLFYGVELFNNTAATLSSASISFVVENYRSGASATDFLNVTYGINNGGLNLGTWTSLAQLNTNSGNVTLSLPLTWNDGDSLWIRWEDTVFSDGTNPKNAAFGIDNFSVTAIPEPSTYALILGVATLGLVGFRRWRAQR